ncbi:MAG: ABC transporter ATP-binding protein [Peptoniphilaceae bacterium]|nr:ABC transporter ATP-binding protein [Peptoniphilaceae bacterium]MDD7383064.1 ABC transporter ATP-binding protein [Peptoniphilaceae bacterium]MDY3737500.1 ABC transporter ATP-binding protein [Peptoniphilaceae bacterium]
MAYISLKNVSKFYKNGESIIKANDKVNFNIEKGEFCIIVGASGAGKSTVLNLLGGMDSPNEGEIIVDGKNIENFNDNELTIYRRNDVGFVFQNYNLIENLTAKENVELANQLVKDSLNAVDVLNDVGLSKRLNNFPSQLSGGEQQRVSIARAVAKKPKILLCDEPTGALDYVTGKKVLKLLKETCKNTNTTVIVITHNRAITPMADRVIEIADGKVFKEYKNEKIEEVENISR